MTRAHSGVVTWTMISSRCGFIPVGPSVWLPLARREEITAVRRSSVIFEAAPGPGSARVPVVVAVAGGDDIRAHGMRRVLGGSAAGHAGPAGRDRAFLLRFVWAGGGWPGLALVESPVVEQRYRTVLAVERVPGRAKPGIACAGKSWSRGSELSQTA